jgi:hypothetical protein
MKPLRVLLIVTVLAAIIFVVTQELSASSGCSVNCTITNDPATWPSGNKIWSICQAAALTEGANTAGSVADNCNNPGNLSKGDEWGQSVTGYQTDCDGESEIVFATKQGGWQALYDKWNNIVTGGSKVYCRNWTWAQIAAKYAGNSQDWLTNMTEFLGVDPSATPEEYVNG